ncbi:4Fe-4S dicluster domain-containing protein [Thermodesulfobacteriota bacterium]
MTEENNIVDLQKVNHQRYKVSTFEQNACSACCLCASSCPVAGIDDFDPRKLVRMFALGMQNDLVESRWPWICTMCGKCEHVCPMQVDIPNMVWHIRSLRARDKVPGILHKGVATALQKGNNLGIPKEDYIFILEDVAEEIAAEPGFKNFKVPIDKKGARILATIHNKLVNTHTDDLKHWWKIFHAAGESWTVPSDDWEGCSWGFFTGDNEAIKTMSGRIVSLIDRLQIKNFLWCE